VIARGRPAQSAILPQFGAVHDGQCRRSLRCRCVQRQTSDGRRDKRFERRLASPLSAWQSCRDQSIRLGTNARAPTVPLKRDGRKRG